MLPRERVLAATSGYEVLPVPMDVFENGIYPQLEVGLREHFGLEKAHFSDLLVALGADLRWGTPIYVGPELEQAAYEGEVAFPFKRIIRNIWGTWEGFATYSDLLERPLAEAHTIADVEAHKWPDPVWFDYDRMTWIMYPEDESLSMPEWAEANADFARIAGDGWSPLFSRVMDLCGFEEGLLKISTEPAVVSAIVNKVGEFYEGYYTHLAKSARGYADFISFGDDFAHQGGMILSPDHWRKFFLPVWKRLFAIAHENDLKPMMHMCGSVRPVLGDLIDAGLEVFEVMQVTAAGMDPVELKREFGQHLTFYGGINTQETLPYGTSEDVRQEVRERIEVMAKGGRYILASMHFLMDEVPPENVLAMYDEARAYVPTWASSKV